MPLGAAAVDSTGYGRLSPSNPYLILTGYNNAPGLLGFWMPGMRRVDPATFGSVMSHAAISQRGIVAALSQGNAPVKIGRVTPAGVEFITSGSPTGGNRNGLALSDDGRLIAFAQTASPYIQVHPFGGWATKDTVDYVGTKWANPATLPAGAPSNQNDIAFSPSGQFVAVGHQTTPFMSIYEIDFGASTLTKIADPASLPAAAVACVAWCAKFLAVGFAGTPFFNIYSYDDTGTFTKLSNPSSLNPNDAIRLAFSPDCRFLFAGGADQGAGVSSGYTYEYDGTTFQRMTAPATVIDGQIHAATFTPDSRHLVLLSGSPYLRIYEAMSDQFLNGETNSAPQPPTGTSALAIWQPPIPRPLAVMRRRRR